MTAWHGVSLRRQCVPPCCLESSVTRTGIDWAGKAVERVTSVREFTVSDDEREPYPVTATLVHQVTGETEVVRCKHLVGADGASSTIRKQLGVKFDGISTDIYWGIMDCVFESTYPHFGIFGYVAFRH